MRFVILSTLILAGCSDMSDYERERLKAGLSGASHNHQQHAAPAQTKMRCTQYHWGTKCKPF